MAATSQAALLAVTEKEFAKLDKLLAKVPQKTAQVPDDDDTSIKDVIAHRAHWIGLFFGWYHDGLAGKQVWFPAEGYKWNELNRYNSLLRANQRDLDWDAACKDLRDAHESLVEFILSRSDEDLYAGPMLGAKNDWTPGRWAEASGPSHYRSAAKYIRARLRS